MSRNKDRQTEYTLFRVWDVVVIVLVLALLAAALYMILAPTQGRSAEIYVDGTLVATVRLDHQERIDLLGLTVVVEEGSIHVEDADCPDKICERMGKISKAGETIICLPNRVVIKILGKGEVEAIT
ncbi:MAG: NusG domain II-containing protein [Clostridia bacterium]|nr:NusG domain II-containing protein [Clostridia bacterium]